MTIKGMNFTDKSGDLELLESLVQSDYWVFEQKLDGTRVLFDLATMTAYQRNGGVLGHTAATQHLPEIVSELSGLGSRPVVLDGELLIGSGEFWVFDWFDRTEPQLSWWGRTARRHAEMSTYLGATRLASAVKSVPIAWTPKEKRALWDGSKSVEGVMAKRRDGLYEPGKRVDHVLKFKHIHTVDAVVIKPPPPAGEGTCSMSVGVYDVDGQLRPIANVTMIGKPPVVEGDVVELNYLYWTGGALYQPRMMRVRDKLPEDCTFDQLLPYSRVVTNF